MLGLISRIVSAGQALCLYHNCSQSEHMQSGPEATAV